MKTKLSFDFVVGHYDDRGLNLQVSANGIEKHFFERVSTDTLVFSLDVDLPCVIEFNVSGKKIDDLVVDHHGNVINDTYFEIKKLILHDINECEIDAWFIPEEILEFRSYPDLLGPKTFWSQNGTANLKFDNNDIVIWFLNHKNLVFNSR